MKNIITIFFSLLTIFLLQSSVSFACSLGLKPLSGFDSKEYIFTGEVVGFVGSFESDKFRQKAWGLKVKIDGAVNLPKKPANYFEIVPYELWADCSTAGTSEEKIVKEFPFGSKVKIIAKEAEILPSTLSDGNIRLEILPGSLGNISRNYFENGKLMTSSELVFDYKAYRRITPDDYTESFMPFLDAQVLLPEFELRKDLLRLTNAKTETERISILERLVYYPECCDFDFDKLVREYVTNSKTQKSLLKKRKKWDERG